MRYIADTLLMAQTGIKSPYIASGPSISPITGQAVMTHRVFPGLGAFVTEGGCSNAMLYLDRLEGIERIHGVLYRTSRGSVDIEDEQVPYWLVQIESGYQAWQFMVPVESVANLSDSLVLCQWIPGGLPDALALHNTILSELWEDNEMLIGSEIERTALAQLSISSGMSSIFHPFWAMGFVEQAKKSMGDIVDVGIGGCEKMRSLPVSWAVLS